MLKKLIGLLLALALVVGVMTIGAMSVFATEDAEPEATEPAPHEHTCEHCEGAQWVAWDGTVAALQQGGHFYLTQETTMDTCFSVELLEKKDIDVTICLNGQTLNGSTKGRMFRLSSGAKLTIVDCTAKTVDGVYTAGSIKPKFHTIKGVVAGIYTDADKVNDSAFTLYDGIIDGGNNSNASVLSSSAIGGGLIDMNSTSAVNLYGGVLKDYTSYYGGAVYVAAGTVTVDGATIQNCNATRGRAIMIRSSGNVVIESGLITGGTTSHGLIALQANGQLTINGGKITNTTGSNANGIHITGAKSVVTMNGGEISGNANYGVWVESGTFNMNDGVISGNKHGVVVESATFNMSGGQITGNTSSAEGNGVRLNKTDGVFNMTGGKIYNNSCTGEKSSCGGVRTMGTFDMSGGQIYGNTAPASNESQVVPADAAAVIKISGDASVAANSKYSFYLWKGDATFEGGTVTGPLVKTDTCTLAISGGMFNTDVEKYTAEGYTQLLTGEVAEVCAPHTLVDGYCTRCGDLDPDAITGTCDTGLSWILSQGELIISGNGAMADFEAGTAPWSEYVSEINALDIKSGVTAIGANAFAGITELTSVSFPVSVKYIGQGAFANSGLTEIEFKGNAPTFDGDAIFAGVTAGVQYPVNDTTWTEDIKASYGGSLSWNGMAHGHSCDNCGSQEWIPFIGVDTTVTNGNNLASGHYYLTDDTTLPMSIDLRGAVDVTICLNGYDLISSAKNRVFRLEGGAKLTIMDCTATGEGETYTAGTIVLRHHGIKGVAFGVFGGELNFYDGIVDGGNNSNASVVNSSNVGGGLIDMNSTSAVNLYGGVLKDYTSYYGGAVHVGGGTLTIDGATIENCNATRGRAIMVRGKNSVAYLKSGKVVGGNTSHALVSMQSGAKFFLEGGLLGNTTGTNGNGVHIMTADCTFTMSGGELAGNEKYGVWIEKGTFIMTGGKIHSNAHGVVVDEGTFNMEGGSISNNVTAAEGAGVRVQKTTGVFTMSGGEIVDNHATGSASSCGGVRVLGQFEMTGGAIYGNTGTTDNTSQVIASDAAANISISGDAFISNMGIDQDGNEVALSVFGINCYRGTVAISGGEFIGAITKNDACALSISGGYFNSDVKAWVAEGYQQYLDGVVRTLCTDHQFENHYCTICGALDPSIPAGECGEKLTWTLIDGVLTISGKGAMYDFDFGTAPWAEYAEEIMSVEIQEGVTSIGKMAFYGCTNMSDISICDDVASIGAYAFYDCTNLPAIIIPENVAEIQEGTFWNSALEAVTIPASVKKIGDWAFYDCMRLQQIEFLGDAPEFAGEEVFANVEASATYPADNATWTEEVTQNYGGTITWPAAHTHTYTYPCDPYCAECGEESNPDAAHNIIHVAAKTPTCTEMGNVEYWYCEYCGAAWLDEACTLVTSLRSVKLGTVDHEYFNPCDQICMNCGQETNPDASHNIIHVEAKTPTCTEMGNVEYWYCDACGAAWLDAEQTLITNLRAVKLGTTDHTFENGSCTVCGEADPDYVPEIELFELKGSSMTLGNTLEINFAVENANISEGDYIVVSKEYADGSVVSKTYTQDEWTAQGSKIRYVSFSVTAKEMNDQLTVIVYNENGQQISETYTDSVAGYCLRKLNEEEKRAAGPRAKYLTLYVDMLNYGAAAQQKWTYNTDALANAELTETQKGYATVIGEKENILQKGEGYKGTSLSLKDNILMNVAFNTSFLTDVKYAEVNFVSHNGVDKSMTVAIEDFIAQGSTTKYISIDVMAVADYAQPVTVKLYNTAGECVSTTVDSMGSYAGRQTKDVYLYEAILAFGMGAYNYFHS